MIALLATAALAQVAPECIIAAGSPAPSWYVDDQHQADFLLNFFALATTFSPVHAAIPDAPGHGSAALELAAIPPLSCQRRLQLNRSKTEDTNKAPVAPIPRLTFTFPKIGAIVPYAGMAYVPPITVFGTRNVITSGELGFGLPFGKDERYEAALRWHYTLMKSIGEYVTPFAGQETAYLDFYAGSTYGVDAMFSANVRSVEPYVAVGFTNVATFLWIGDDGVIGNNLHPFQGLTASLGMQGHIGHLVVAGEAYGTPGHVSTGYIYTGRLRVGAEI
jgi:hypothetical protein